VNRAKIVRKSRQASKYAVVIVRESFDGGI